jgi:hypothetical protein
MNWRWWVPVVILVLAIIDRCNENYQWSAIATCYQ